MSNTKFLYLYRNPPGPSGTQPSPEEREAMFARWRAWKAKFIEEIVDVGDGLKPGGAMLKAGTITDGPYIEAKEVVAGYSMVSVSSLTRAVEIAKECPINLLPGASIEIRELMGF